MSRPGRAAPTGYSVSASVLIAAAPQTVWDVLVDVGSYGRWNPFTPRVRSALGVGDPVHLDVVLGPRRRTRSVNHVEIVDAPHRLVWSSTLGHPRLLRTRRTQTVEPAGEGSCRYTTSETFEGPLAPLVGLVSRAAVQRGFVAVADSLRDHVEGLGDGGAAPRGGPHGGTER